MYGTLTVYSRKGESSMFTMINLIVINVINILLVIRLMKDAIEL